jgi:flagellar protein FlgJ
MSAPASDVSVYTDFQGLAQLQREAKTDPSGALRKVAKQFEAVFLQMMLKSMRDASLGDGMFNSDQMKTYREMFDQQISLTLSDEHTMGIADMLVKQLSGVVGKSKPAASGPAAAAAGGSGGTGAVGDKASFLRAIWPFARHAAVRIGVTPDVVAAQAALESNWGRGVSRFPDGRSSHNVFGIKADAAWDGPTVTVPTLEYKGGELVKERAPFRAYGSYGESFSDYADFLQANPRYRDALATGGTGRGFIAGLQQAGYATDPEYATKVMSILENPAFGKTVTELKNSREVSLL